VNTNKTLAAFILFGGLHTCLAGTIVLTGQITQSVQDGTGPAVNNPSLNNIVDLEAYTLTLVFPLSPGTYNLTGSTARFSVPAAPASEMSFGAISLTISANGPFDDFSLLACLTTGSGCAFGNQLNANFEILASMISSQNVMTTGLDQPHPLDLLEDDGITDIQGSITSYSSVPEPAFTGVLGCALLGFLAAKRRFTKTEEK
jgi:hypothetical protein